MVKMVLWSKKIQYIYAQNIFMVQIYIDTLAVHDTVYKKGSRPKLLSWNTFGEGLGKSRKTPSYRTSPRKKIRLDLDVSSNQKDSINDFSIQTG